MKKFIINIIIFGSIIFCIHNISFMLAGSFWGNDMFTRKFAYYKKNKDQFNSIILGSSRLNSGINPSILDSLCNFRIQTYNLSSPAVGNPEVYFLFEHLLRSGKPLPKYVFIELSPLNSVIVDRMEINEPRFYYWQNVKYLYFIVRYVISSKYSSSIKATLLSTFIKSQITKYTSFSQYKTLVNRYTKKSKSFKKGNNGFMAIDEEVIAKRNTKKKRNANFINDTLSLYELSVLTKREFSKPDHSGSFNNFHYTYLMKLIKQTKNHGVNLFFVVPPRSKTYEEELALLEKLPAEHVIEIANPLRYPKLYHAKYTFDKRHFNNSGADLLTGYFADEFIKKALADQ